MFENFNFVDETLIVYIQCFVTLVESSTESVSQPKCSPNTKVEQSQLFRVEAVFLPLYFLLMQTKQNALD